MNKSIYLPTRFQVDKLNEVTKLIEENPLATVISSIDGELFISHLPLIVKLGDQNDLKLIGHLAKANPHWKFLESNPLTIIFHGPQAYITPTWYAQNDAPTWNYAVVHLKGKARLISDYEGIVGCLKELTKQMEANSKNPWQFWVPEDLAEKSTLMSAIIGFEISVEDIQAKFKLGQNRTSGDKEGAIRGLLSERKDQDSHQIAELMKRFGEPV